MKRLLAAVPLLILYVTHVDLWQWNDATIVLGLPVGLAYHVGACLLAVGALAVLVRWGWPHELIDEASAGESSERTSSLAGKGS